MYFFSPARANHLLAPAITISHFFFARIGKQPFSARVDTIGKLTIVAQSEHVTSSPLCFSSVLFPSRCRNGNQ